MAYKGKFKPTNPHKYAGDPTKIIYRSLWERKFMKYCDNTDSVLEWASEEIAIPYYSPVDSKMHRYYPDFIVRIKTNKEIKTYIIEVKPKKQTRPPKKKKRMTKGYLTEVKTFAINESKWKAAKKFAQSRGWEFKILTEDTLKP